MGVGGVGVGVAGREKWPNKPTQCVFLSITVALLFSLLRSQLACASKGLESNVGRDSRTSSVAKAHIKPGQFSHPAQKYQDLRHSDPESITIWLLG